MRAIIFLGGAVMVASWGLTWIALPFAGPDLSPMSLVRDGQLTLGGESAWQTWVFLGGFAAAALAALWAVNGRGAGVFALLAGLSPVVVLADAIIRADTVRKDLGLPFQLDFKDLQTSWSLMENFVRIGLWAYLGGAGVLLLAGLLSLGRRR